jgi:hypothetical protein
MGPIPQFPSDCLFPRAFFSLMGGRRRLCGLNYGDATIDLDCSFGFGEQTNHFPVILQAFDFVSE